MNDATQFFNGAAGGGDVLGVEDVFSTWLYTGNGSTQTITNGIDLAGEGGLVWTKARSAAYNHILVDTVRGRPNSLFSNATNTQSTASDISSFSSTGYNLELNNGYENNSGITYASWTFRKAEKFFDVVAYTGNSTSQNIAHSLGSEPGFVIIKATSATSNWVCYHRSIGIGNAVFLNLTNGSTAASDISAVSSTTFSVSGNQPRSNESGQTYVAYLFAHDAGGFGDSGDESVIKCDSFITNASGLATINLGWEPQWILFKATNEGTQNWRIFDTMRGWTANTSSNAAGLDPNVPNAEATRSQLQLLSTGFYSFNLEANKTYIYIAIRRGPMKTPTVGTQVFSASTASTGNNTPGFVTDNLWTFYRDGGAGTEVRSRLQGNTPYLVTSSTAAETTGSDYKWDTNNGVNYTWGNPYIGYYFRRAPGFFDVVAYTGTGSARTVAHNLGVAPQLIITKPRSLAVGWGVYSEAIGASNILSLNTAGSSQAFGSALWNATAPTSTEFSVNTSGFTNGSSYTYIAYLFATCPGVSKVGSYTGTGGTLNVDCGFTAGARFVLIKRTNATGDWYVWDTARGIVSGNDPYLLLNSTAAEVTSHDYIDPLASGFQISATSPAGINASGSSYIFLAIA